MAINKNDFKNGEGNYEAKNALMDAVIDGINGIVESGSNSRGEWIKYADGTMECYLVTVVNNFTLSYSFGVGGLGFNYYEWIYPEPFLSTPHVDVGQAQISSGVQWGSTRQNTAAKAQAVVWGALNNTGTLNISLYAKGRWKA